MFYFFTLTLTEELIRKRSLSKTSLAIRLFSFSEVYVSLKIILVVELIEQKEVENRTVN